jgi:hypothetical protein
MTVVEFRVYRLFDEVSTLLYAGAWRVGTVCCAVWRRTSRAASNRRSSDRGVAGRSGLVMVDNPPICCRLPKRRRNKTHSLVVNGGGTKLSATIGFDETGNRPKCF